MHLCNVFSRRVGASSAPSGPPSPWDKFVSSIWDGTCRVGICYLKGRDALGLMAKRRCSKITPTSLSTFQLKHKRYRVVTLPCERQRRRRCYCSPFGLAIPFIKQHSMALAYGTVQRCACHCSRHRIAIPHPDPGKTLQREGIDFLYRQYSTVSHVISLLRVPVPTLRHCRSSGVKVGTVLYCTQQTYSAESNANNTVFYLLKFFVI